MYFNVNFNAFFKLIKVYLLVSELYCVKSVCTHNGKVQEIVNREKVFINKLTVVE